MKIDPELEQIRKMRGKDEVLAPNVLKIERSNPVAGPSGVVITEEGLVVVDTGMPQEGPDRVRRIREHMQAPFHTIIYSHGHGDHVGGIHAFIEDNEKKGYPVPRIIGHELVAKRFDKYRMLAGRRRYIGMLQFPTPEMLEASEGWQRNRREYQYVYPDTTFSSYMDFKLGGFTFQLFHAPAETDDTIWVWVPERKLAMLGDLLIGGCPNTGNPLKEQRYTLEWAEALEKIAEKQPDFIIAGPGALRGRLAVERCQKAARLLRFIQDEVVRLLNEGKWIEDILAEVKLPQDLAEDPWLQGTYGHPVFVIHDVYRRYTGWYDGNPGELFPSPSAEVAAEIIELVNPERLLERARQLQGNGSTQLALHVTDFVVKGCKDTKIFKEAMLLKAGLLEKRAGEVGNFIAGNIMRTSAALLRKDSS
ncbi:MAG: alkyl sulfatase dimerization domain-containing protein [Dehalococcoidia bacterium]|nr:alkyl sulfatase dimerization domain-containing protein [Dehalococcoidia bacterium]